MQRCQPAQQQTVSAPRITNFMPPRTLVLQGAPMLAHIMLDTYLHLHAAARRCGVKCSGKDVIRTKLVEQLPISELDGKGNLWTMSPPCQVR